MRIFLLIAMLLAGMGLSSCTHYIFYGRTIKLIGFEDSFVEAKSIGPVQGRDCYFSIFPTPGLTHDSIANAVGKIRTQRGSQAGIRGSSSSTKPLRYIKNVSAIQEILDFLLFQKICMDIEGEGFK